MAGQPWHFDKYVVKLKVKGGRVCDIMVKYERLPMICFFSWRLGHGSNECVDISGDCTPKKRYGAFLRASP